VHFLNFSIDFTKLLPFESANNSYFCSSGMSQ